MQSDNESVADEDVQTNSLSERLTAIVKSSCCLRVAAFLTQISRVRSRTIWALRKQVTPTAQGQSPNG